MFGKKKPKIVHTYLIVGPDGQDQGPFAPEEIRRRIEAGEITPSTLMRRDDIEHWSTPAEFPEFALKDKVVTPYDQQAGPDALAVEMEEAEYGKRIRQGAGWFFWIASLSVINTLSATFHIPWGYALGLTSVYLIGEVGARFGSEGAWVAMIINLLASGLYYFFGVAGWQKYFFPYLLGMLIYAGDTAVAVMVQDWISVALHVVALLFMFLGVRAHMERREQRWGMGLTAWMLGGALVVAACGFGLHLMLKARPEKIFAQKWSGLPHEKWPGLVLTHDADFKGHSSLFGGSAFLVSLGGSNVVAATAKHLIGPDGGVVPKLHPAELASAITRWNLHTRANTTNVIEVTGLYGENYHYGSLDDWLLLKLKETTNAWPTYPLTLRQTQTKLQEPVFVVGVRYDDKSGKQEVFPGKVTVSDGEFLEGELDAELDLTGFSGAPVLDAGGNVVGVLTGPGLSAGSSKRTFSAHAVAEVDWALPDLDVK